MRAVWSAATDQNREIPWNKLKLMLEDAEHSKAKRQKTDPRKAMYAEEQKAKSGAEGRSDRPEPRRKVKSPWMFKVSV